MKTICSLFIIFFLSFIGLGNLFGFIGLVSVIFSSAFMTTFVFLAWEIFLRLPRIERFSFDIHNISNLEPILRQQISQQSEYNEMLARQNCIKKLPKVFNHFSPKSTSVDALYPVHSWRFVDVSSCNDV